MASFGTETNEKIEETVTESDMNCENSNNCNATENSSKEPAGSNSVTEGKATIVFPGQASVFYNPVQEFNRDLSIAILHQLFLDRKTQIKELTANTEDGNTQKLKRRRFCDPNTPVRLLEGLAASGLRAIRYAKELPEIREIIANDFSDTAVECIRENVLSNGVENTVKATFGDAVMVMHENKHVNKQFHAIDLDPYGTATPFLDAAVQSVMDEGLLMVTCTDTAVLCGNTPEACFAKYGSMALRARCCHEIALRILLNCIETQANRYGRYIEPLVSVSVDFYIRVFVRLYSGPAVAKTSCCKRAMIYSCVNCESLELQPLAKRIDTAKGGVKFMNATAPTVPTAICEHCGGRQQIAGPIWSASLHKKDFVDRLLQTIKDSAELAHLRTRQRITGVLSVVSEELNDVPLYYVHDRLSVLLKCPTPPSRTFRSALLNGGYRVSLSHANPRSIKTDAPNYVIWDIMRCWAIKMQAKPPAPGSTAEKVLLQPSKFEPNFTDHPDAAPQSLREGLLRFQQNPEKYWGPKPKAKGSISSKRSAGKAHIADDDSSKKFKDEEQL